MAFDDTEEPVLGICQRVEGILIDAHAKLCWEFQKARVSHGSRDDVSTKRRGV